MEKVLMNARVNKEFREYVHIAARLLNMKFNNFIEEALRHYIDKKLKEKKLAEYAETLLNEKNK